MLWGANGSAPLEQLESGTTFGGRLADLAGRSVLLRTGDQLAAALALIELDGVARRVVICTPDVSREHLPGIIARAAVDALVSDSIGAADIAVPLRVECGRPIAPLKNSLLDRCTTQWVLLTSGTTGAPKLFVHTLRGLTAAIDRTGPDDPDLVWGTFYDIRRYGGLQILLRALLGRGSFVLSDLSEPAAKLLERLAAHSVTHISGTPTHWRRVLMIPGARSINPRYVRLSGEIADQAVINALAWFYPQARIAHAYASTEAGVAFEVGDGLEGFPEKIIGRQGDVEIKVVNGSLRVRSQRVAVKRLDDDAPLTDEEGFVDTGDTVELRDHRYHFLGRNNGAINIGGLKVYPEEVERVLNGHPAVRMSVVHSRRSAITGSLVAADVVLKESTDMKESGAQADIKAEILRICGERLATYKIPATIRFVPSLEVGPAGKIARADA
jgi:acyl-coenzyme A synthetase/AMP-(fatty) acid ligase